MMETTEQTRPQTLFLYGCPRSGTTWVQLLLDRHLQVVTAPETHIFSFYLNRLKRQWEHELSGEGHRGQGMAGLSQLFGQEEFDSMCRAAAEYVLGQIARREPCASVVLEKSPQHARQAEWIAGLFPRALFLHVIRDPRDTVASLLAAGRSWGRDWAPGSVVDAARYWNGHVDSGRRLRRLGPRYLEVRYESLKEDAVEQLARILSWLGLRANDGFCEEAVETCRLENLRRKPSEDLPLPGTRIPEGFFRKGRSGGWREDLNRSQLRIVESICADRMDELGYEREYSSVGLAGGRILLHDAIVRIREGLDWQLERLARLM